MINLAGNPQVASVLAGSNRLSPTHALALVSLALLALLAGAVTAHHQAGRRGQTLREWWDGLR